MSESRKNRRELEEELQQLIRKLEPGRPLGLAIMSILVGMSPVLAPYLIATQPGPDPRRISNVNLCTSSALISLDFYLPAFTTAFATAMVLSLTPLGQGLRDTRMLQGYNRSLSAIDAFTILGIALSANYLITLACAEIKKLYPTLPAEACFIITFTLLLFTFGHHGIHLDNVDLRGLDTRRGHIHAARGIDHTCDSQVLYLLDHHPCFLHSRHVPENQATTEPVGTNKKNYSKVPRQHT